MDKARICRELAEKLEPVSQYVIAFPMVAVSPRGFWRGYGVVTGWKWGAVNFFTDEAACARLLEAMPKPQVWKDSHRGFPGEKLRGHPESDWITAAEPHIPYCYHADRKTAIALAACKWLGISTE